jgi:hypothetical protein
MTSSPDPQPASFPCRESEPPARLAGPGTEWRRWLRRKIGWLLVAKIVALILMWNLSFSTEHRLEVTPARVDARLALDGGSVAPAAPDREEKHD